MKVKMLHTKVGRQGVHGYRAERFEKGKVYEVSEELGNAFLEEDTYHGGPAAEKAKGNPKVEPKKEGKQKGPEENK
jgi:hypothetical protein